MVMVGKGLAILALVPVVPHSHCFNRYSGK